ncbi:hypothetical protein [Mycobacterium phage Weirdo19]|uniref:Uncharacterized protein n=1 Tax=Mycobacterium phage Weirdo19 TaxID=2601610 RepID=A0A6M2YT07_9CAUD|nr:hypothetical protein KDJ11_gp64 [Mycobacterium phage Weirdo19]QEA10832.1 hypothetical protein [Mycobacterium phage Weirdo19]
MRTPEDLAARDAALDVDAGHPELDPRSIRCQCRHSLSAHRQRTMADLNAPGIPTPTVCTRCRCRRYTTRAGVWTVRTEQFRDLWIVRSPTGTRVYSSHDRAAALTIANALGVTARMLVRTGRLEQHLLGDHPALRAAQELAARVRAGVLTEEQARQHITRALGPVGPPHLTTINSTPDSEA